MIARWQPAPLTTAGHVPHTRVSSCVMVAGYQSNTYRGNRITRGLVDVLRRFVSSPFTISHNQRVSSAGSRGIDDESSERWWDCEVWCWRTTHTCAISVLATLQITVLQIQCFSLSLSLSLLDHLLSSRLTPPLSINHQIQVKTRT